MRGIGVLYQKEGKGARFLARRKGSPAAIFSDETGFPCTFGADGKTCKETLMRKASETDAHVVSFGTKVGGLRPL